MPFKPHSQGNESHVRHCVYSFYLEYFHTCLPKTYTELGHLITLWCHTSAIQGCEIMPVAAFENQQKQPH